MDQYGQQNTPGGQKPSGMSNTRPRMTIITIVLWVLIQTYRLTAFSLVQSVQAGTDPAAWLFPGIMDIFIGITAPFVAYIIWRRTGLFAWTTAIVWFFLSITDHMDALTATLSGPLSSVMASMGVSGVTTMLLVMTGLDIMCLATLASAKMKAHYLGSFR